MPTIKNHLTKTFGSFNIPGLVQHTANNYRPYDPGQYLYKLVMDFPSETKFSEKFIELVYATLISWNMNQRRAKLSDFETFKKSLLEHKQTIESLYNQRIEVFADSNNLIQKIKFLFENLQLVDSGKPKLVTFSKTLHYIVPNLLMPIDRTYTIRFFYNNTDVPFADEKQFEMYCDIFNEFRQLATTYNFDNHFDGNWNRNIPKIIDNVIIAYETNRK